MAVEKIINLKVNDDIKDTENNVVSLKRQLREAQQDVQNLADKFGATSREAVEAAKKAAELKDRIGDAKALTDTFNPDAKFRALTQSLSGAAGGLSAVTGAMGLLGTESEDVEAAMLKVQSAMAISQGIQAVGESIDSFKQLGAVIQDAGIFQKANTAITAIAATVQKLFTGAVNTTATSFKGLKAAIVSTGIGALVVGLGYLISKMMESTEATADNEEALKSLTEAQKVYENSLRNNIYQIENSTKVRVLRAKIAGKSEKELRDIEKEGENERADATDAEIKRMDKELENKKLSQAAYSKLIEDRNKLADESLKLAQDRDNAQLEFELGIEEKRRENGSKANEKAIEKKEADKKKAIEKKEADEKKAIEEEKARLDKLNTLYETYLKENQDLNALSEQEKLDLQKQRDLEEINQLAKTANEKANLKALLDEKYFNLQQQLDKKLAEDKAKKDAEKIAKEDAEWLRLQELTMQKSEYEKLALTQKYEAEYLAAQGNAELQTELKKKLEKDLSDIDDKAKEDAKQKEQALLDAKLAFAQQGLSLVAEIAGKGSKVGKAVAVAQATISGIEGVQNAYTTAQKSPITIGFPAYPYVQAGLAGVFSALQIRKILSTNAGGSTSAASSAGGGGGGAAPPSFNIVGQNSNNQLAQTIAGQQQQPLQAYVVSGNVSSAQSLDRNRIDTATFN